MRESSASGALKEVSGLLIVLGVAQVVMGSICILLPILAGAALALVIGILLLASGIVELIQATRTKGFGKGAIGYLGGVLGIVGGLLVIVAPYAFLTFLTLLVAIYFFIDGIQRVSLAWSLKPLEGWGWVMFGGVVGLLLGAMLISGWPDTGQWVIGLLIGIRVVFRGWTVLMIALAARRATAAA